MVRTTTCILRGLTNHRRDGVFGGVTAPNVNPARDVAAQQRDQRQVGRQGSREKQRSFNQRDGEPHAAKWTWGNHFIGPTKDRCILTEPDGASSEMVRRWMDLPQNFIGPGRNDCRMHKPRRIDSMRQSTTRTGISSDGSPCSPTVTVTNTRSPSKPGFSPPGSLGGSILTSKIKTLVRVTV